MPACRSRRRTPRALLGTALAAGLLLATPVDAQSGAAPVPSPAPVPSVPMAGMTEQPCIAPTPQTDWAALCRYRAADIAQMRAGRPTVVFMGDSISEFWGRLDPAFFARGAVNRGIAGQTSQQMLLRFQQDVVRLRPRAVQILAGTNDIAGNTGPTAPQDYQDTITAMVQLARANGIAVILGTVPPSAKLFWAPTVTPAPWIEKLNSWLRAYTARSGIVLADYHTALADADGAMKKGFSEDGVHPNAAGYAAMRPVALKAIAAALAKAQR